jgi:carbon-monoxide dehydrogenase small subunit
MDGPVVPVSQVRAAGQRDRLRLALIVNGEDRDLVVASYKTLLEVLREDLALTGTKHGCELGECGACAVLLDGELVLSCLVAAVECPGRATTTVEGLREGPALHPLQAAFADFGGSQCGYCTPGMLLAAKSLLDRNPKRADRQALSGQICRCTCF